ncbi:MAG: hypothetical protein QXI27_03910 [Nitrososphaerota archaeon]
MTAMDKESAIREILARENSDPEFMVAADIMRAMVILYGSGWESDVLDVVSGLWTLKNLPMDKMSILQARFQDGAKILEKAGIITIQLSPRAYLEESKPVEEKLYKTPDLTTLLRMLAADRYIDKYRFELSGWVIPRKQ